MSMDIRYHYKRHKHQNGEDRDQSRKPGPGTPTCPSLIDDAVVVGRSCVLFKQRGFYSPQRCIGDILVGSGIRRSRRGRPYGLGIIAECRLPSDILEVGRPD